MSTAKATVSCPYCEVTINVTETRKTHQGVSGYAIMPNHGRGEFGCMGSFSLVMPNEVTR